VPSAGTGNLRGERRRAQILQAAVRVVARGGAGALTHRAAAAEAGVSLASVTYHFPGIADLRRETVAHAADVVAAEFGVTWGHDESPALRAALPDGVDADTSDRRAVVMALVEEWERIGLARRAEFMALFTFLVEGLHDPEIHDQVDGLLAMSARMLTDAGWPPDLADGVVAALTGLALVVLVGIADAGNPAAESSATIAMRRFRASAAVLFAGLGSDSPQTTRAVRARGQW
jgi:AcrR family transcriptional regulator